MHPDRLFPVDPTTRDVARVLFATVEKASIVSPHGHTDPRWWGDNPAFENPAAMLVQPDHYVLRMLVSWTDRVVPTYRPDSAVDPEFEGVAANLDLMGELTGCDKGTWSGYLDAHHVRRAYFIDLGATATDHGHPTDRTTDLPPSEAAAMYERIRGGVCS